MTKNLQKTFAIVSTVLTILVTQNSFADTAAKDSKPKSQTVSNTQTSEDPDLKLSIEELRKKYPISWLKKKYGDFNHPTCNEEGAFIYEGQVPKNLVCDFINIKEENLFEDFSYSEIKSVFVYEPYDFLKQKSSSARDPRLIHLIEATFRYFQNKPKNILTVREAQLKEFIYSDKVLNPILTSSSCYEIKRKTAPNSSISCK